MHGGSDEAFGASFREIAKSVHLMAPGEDQDTLLEVVKSWFETPVSGNWTIVIDNLDDIELQSRLYIPICHGEVLFTTRDERILGHPGLVPVGAGIEVSRMGEKEATETFCRIIGSGGLAGTPATGQLLALLDGLPLAIAQAASYIRTTHMSTARYLALFQKGEEYQEELLSEPLPAAVHSDRADLSRAVMTTWTLSVQKIEQESPLSIKLLHILSFLDPDNLPSSLIEAALSAETRNYFKQLAPLLNFGLLSHLGPSNYRLHRLVSMWARIKMGSDVKHQFTDQAVLLMTTCFPLKSCENVIKYAEMLPHAVSILDHMRSNGWKFSSEPSWELQYHVVKFLGGIGQLHLAMKHAQLLLEQKKVFEQDESKRYISRAILGEIFHSMADYASAINEYQHALNGLENVLGKDHPATLGTVHNMAIVFKDKGEYDQALQWYQRTLDGEEKTFGKDHPETLTVVHNMASVFVRKEDYDKALEWYQRALDGREKALGRGHPRTLSTAHNMAIVFAHKGDCDKALGWNQRALDVREKALGRGHPRTLSTVHNMAIVFANKGEYEKALEWYQRTLDGMEKTLGKGHPETLTAVHNMALVFSSKGDYDKALEWNQRALDGREKTLGRGHPRTLSTVHNMASVFENKGEYGKALEWYQRALDGRKKALGEDHHVTISTAKNMARLRKLSNSTPSPTPAPNRETYLGSWALLRIPCVRSPWRAKNPKPM